MKSGQARRLQQSEQLNSIYDCADWLSKLCGDQIIYAKADDQHSIDPEVHEPTVRVSERKHRRTLRECEAEGTTSHCSSLPLSVKKDRGYCEEKSQA